MIIKQIELSAIYQTIINFSTANQRVSDKGMSMKTVFTTDILILILYNWVLSFHTLL